MTDILPKCSSSYDGLPTIESQKQSSEEIGNLQFSALQLLHTDPRAVLFPHLQHATSPPHHICRRIRTKFLLSGKCASIRRDKIEVESLFMLNRLLGRCVNFIFFSSEQLD